MSQTKGWNFHYRLTEKIDCEKTIRQSRENVKFITERSGTQMSITGFEISINGSDQDEAKSRADGMSERLVDLLSGVSGTHSEPCLEGEESF